jgi:hypothetical protein
MVAALPYVKNIVVYQNPFWPVRVPIFASLFSYRIDVAEEGRSQRPPPLRELGQPRLFWHSLFEIGHPTRYPDRPRWVIDQGGAWISYRMGGFWRIAAIVYLAGVLALLIVLQRRRGAITAAAGLAMLGFVALLPQSHELRYYLFIPLCGAAVVAMHSPALRQRWPAAAFALCAVVVVLFLRMVDQNRVHYRVEQIGHRQAADFWTATWWWPRLQPERTYCAVDMMPISMLLTGPTMREFTIVDRTSADLCPEGAVVLARNGTQSFPAGARAATTVARTRDPRAIAALNDSLSHYAAGRFEDSIRSAAAALTLEPDSAAAHNNLCAGHASLQRWDEALTACENALAHDPTFTLARNNLAWARSGKAARAAASLE